MTTLKNSTILGKVIFVLAVAICFGFLGFYFGQQRTPQNVKEAEKLATPTVAVQLNKEFEFPIEEAPESDASYKMILTDAKKVKLVATQGEPIQAEAGKEFLILTLEIENDNAFPFEVNNQHYFRLQGEEDKSYAPDFYNDLIEIPAVSTKKDELGFIVPAEQMQFKLLVGPIIEEEKEEIVINF